MAHKHVKGENINLLINGSVIAASDSCDFTLKSNTSDTSAKDDPGLGEWDNPTFENYSWNASNSSFVVETSTITNLLSTVVNGTAMVTAQFNINAGTGGIYAVTGTAIITSLEIDAPADGKAKINISLEGATPLSVVSNPTAPVAASSILSRIKGKSLMVAVSDGASTPKYHTVMCSTGHKLTVNVQTGDVTDKDANDNFLYKEVTGRSVQLSTDNLIPTYSSTDKGVDPTSFISSIINGSEADVRFGYYAASVGAEASKHDWNETIANPMPILSGKFIVSDFSMNGQVKQNASYSATFQSKGAPSVSGAPQPAD